MNHTGPRQPFSLWGALWGLIYRKVVQPFLQTHDPVSEMAMGAAIGIFFGLTPTVGVQMYMVTGLWLLFRFFRRLRFNIVVGMAMVWISNPVTMLPMYYLWYVTGIRIEEVFGLGGRMLEYSAFGARMEHFSTQGDQSWLDWLLSTSTVLLVDMGWPMMVGSMVYAVPGFLITYPMVVIFLRRYRAGRARRAGLDYEQWREKFEARR